MSQRTFSRILSLVVLVIVSAAIAVGQSPISPVAAPIPNNDAWKAAQSTGSIQKKILVVTLDEPQRRQTCHIQSFTVDKLVCSHAIGGSRTYLPDQVIALILPSDRVLKILMVLGLNGGSGAAIWGTVAFAATCPACAVATGIVAVALLCAAGAVLIGDDQPERLLYLAPGRQLTGKLRFVPS